MNCKKCKVRQIQKLDFTGHTQKNGAVSIVFTIETAPFFCVCPVFPGLSKIALWSSPPATALGGHTDYIERRVTYEQYRTLYVLKCMPQHTTDRCSYVMHCFGLGHIWLVRCIIQGQSQCQVLQNTIGSSEQ